MPSFGLSVSQRPLDMHMLNDIALERLHRNLRRRQTATIGLGTQGPQPSAVTNVYLDLSLLPPASLFAVSYHDRLYAMTPGFFGTMPLTFRGAPVDLDSPFHLRAGDRVFARLEWRCAYDIASWSVHGEAHHVYYKTGGFNVLSAEVRILSRHETGPTDRLIPLQAQTDEEMRKSDVMHIPLAVIREDNQRDSDGNPLPDGQISTVNYYPGNFMVSRFLLIEAGVPPQGNYT